MQVAQPGELLVPAVPTTYTLELTSRCNSACIGCGNVFERALGEMDAARWETLLEKLAPHALSIRLTGGEPTLHAGFGELLHRVDRLGVPFVIFTNGLWVDPERTLAALLACRRLDGLLVSLHGKDAASQRAFAGVDSFERVTETIRRATQAGLRLNTNTVLTRANYQDIGAIADLSQALGASYAAFSRYYGPPTPVTDLSEAEFQGAASAIHEMKRQGRAVTFNNCVPACFDGQPTKSCPAGITHCTVNPLGQVRPCTHSPQVLGDLFTQEIGEIWQGAAAQEWRALIPDVCYSCAEFARCRGGCKALIHHLGCAADPLLRAPLAEPLPSGLPESVQLYQGARPRPNFTLRQEDFGYLLVNRNQIVPVGDGARPLLDRLDGQTTLLEIRERFGQPALEFVAYLFYKGLVYLDQE